MCVCVRVYEEEYCFCDKGDTQSKYGDEKQKEKAGKKQQLDGRQTGWVLFLRHGRHAVEPEPLAPKGEKEKERE